MGINYDNIKPMETYHGIPLEDLTKEELIEAIESIWKKYQETIREAEAFLKLAQR